MLWAPLGWVVLGLTFVGASFQARKRERKAVPSKDDQLLSATHAPDWESGFEKAIRDQLDQMVRIPDVLCLLQYLIIYGAQDESDVSLKFGGGTVRFAEEEYLLNRDQNRIDVSDRLRPILSKLIYEYTDTAKRVTKCHPLRP